MPKPRRTPPFPPPSISHPAWLEDGSDAGFREFIYKMLRLAALLLQSRERFAAMIGVSAPQYALIVITAEEGEVTAGLLAERMGVSPPFVTAEVGKLVRRGLLEKRPSEVDARSNVIRLTPKARQLLLELAPLRCEVNDMIYGGLDREQVQALTRLVGVLHDDAARALHMLDGPEHRDARVPSAPRVPTA